MTTATLPTLNKALDELVQALQAIDDLEGLAMVLSGYAAQAAAFPESHSPSDDGRALGVVWGRLADAAAAVLDLRTTTQPLPADTEGK